MKVFVLAAALATLSVNAPAGAARGDNPSAAADRMTATMVADAGRLGSASLTALNGSHWAPAERRLESDPPFDDRGSDIDTGTLILGISGVALLALRLLARELRRQEQQRRAAALAATLPRH
ncbi:MAG: hypothetical protein EOP35_25590 [Rubrivivax sp.]|nr:MAG: hypothetical protein EOP35_25590 [Rubrivivax sp.]